MSYEKFFFDAGARIAELRGGQTQAAFAERIGVDRKTVARWEAGERLPDGVSLVALSAVYGADLNYILGGHEVGQKVDPAEAALLASFRRCSDQGKMTLIQTAALLGSGLSPGADAQGAGRTRTIVQNIRAPVTGGVAGNNIINKRKPK